MRVGHPKVASFVRHADDVRVKGLLCAAIAALEIASVSAAAAGERYAVIPGAGAPPARAQRVRQLVEGRGEIAVELRGDSAALNSARAVAAQQLSAAMAGAEKDYLAGRIAGAIRRLEQLERSQLANLLGTEAGRALLVELNLRLGALQRSAGRAAASDDRWRLALGLDRGARINEVWPPGYAARVEELRGHSPPAGALTVNAGAAESASAVRLEIDGRPMASSLPATVKLPAGLHYLSIRKLGRSAYAERIAIRAGGVHAIAPELPAPTAASVAADLADLERAQYPDDTAGAVAVVASAAQASRVIVVAADELALYRADGSLLTAARGADLAAAVDLLLGELTGAKVGGAGASDRGCRSVLCTWWFWTAAGAVAVVGGVAIYAVTRESDAFTGRFVSPLQLSW